MRNLSAASQRSRLGRVWSTVQQKENAAFDAWLKTRTEEELDELIRIGDVCRGVADGLLPQDDWTEAMAQQWTEAMAKGKNWKGR